MDLVDFRDVGKERTSDEESVEMVWNLAVDWMSTLVEDGSAEEELEGLGCSGMNGVGVGIRSEESECRKKIWFDDIEWISVGSLDKNGKQDSWNTTSLLIKTCFLYRSYTL